MSYQELFHDMIIESQGPTYAENSGLLNTPGVQAYHRGVRDGVLNGITLGYRTMAEAGHIPMAIYDQWHAFVYSEEMEKPRAYRAKIIDERSNN